MGIRDLEISRLLHYAKGLGVKVTIYNRTHPNMEAEWATDGSSINIYAGKACTKTNLILHFLHELGHMTAFINQQNRQVDEAFDEALEEGADEKKKHRLKILQVERAGITWWDQIIKDVDIKLASWKIEAQKEIDILQYEVFYERGDWLGGKERDKAYKKIRAKWKAKLEK